MREVGLHKADQTTHLPALVSVTVSLSLFPACLGFTDHGRLDLGRREGDPRFHSPWLSCVGGGKTGPPREESTSLGSGYHLQQTAQQGEGPGVTQQPQLLK